MQVVLCLAILTELTVFTYLISISLPFVRSLLELVLIPLNLGLNYITTAFAFVLDNLSHKTQQNRSGFRSSPLFSIIIGLIVGLPVIYILGTLFFSADPIFATVVKNAFSAQFFQRLPIHLMFSLSWLHLLCFI